MSKISKIYKDDMSKEPISDELIAKTMYSMKTRVKSNKDITRQYRWGVIVPIAASLLITITVAAAVLVPYFLKPSDWGGYQGHVYTQSGEDEIVKNLDENLLSSIGMNIDESVSNNNLTVTVKDIIYDKSVMYINFDIHTNDGSPLQENTEYSKSLLYRQKFSDAYIEREGQKYNFDCFRIDNAFSPDKASFEGWVTNTDFYGKTIKFVLSDFEDEVEYSTNIGFSYNSLSDVYKMMTPTNSEDFINLGTYITYVNGKKVYLYTLPDGNQNIRFSDKYPDAYIDNIGFSTVGEGKTKDLYLSIVPGSEENAEELKNLAFKNILTGDIIYSSYPNSGENVDLSLNNGKIILTLDKWADHYYKGEIRDLTEADLSNYVIVGSPSTEKVVREKGTWSFDFKIDKIAEAKTCSINQTIQINSVTITIDTITLSPLNLLIEGTSINPDGIKLPVAEAYFTMQDGAKQILSHKGASGEFDSTIDLQFTLDKIINVDDIQSLNIWDTAIPLN